MTPLKKVLSSRLLPWVVAALTTTAAVTFAVLWLGTERDPGTEEVEDRARSFVLALTNFSSETIDDDVQEIRSFATGSFEDEVDELFSEDTIEAIRSAEASSEATVDALFVQSLTEDEASVFAVVTESVTNQTLDEPRTDIVRMEITLEKEGERWMVEAVELFQSPGDGLPGA